MHVQVLQAAGNTAGCDFTLFGIPLSGADVAKQTKLPQSNLCLEQRTPSSDLYTCIIKTKLPSLVIKTTLTAVRMHLNLLMSTDTR